MTIHKTQITLEIQWEDEEADHPGIWDWAALLDLPDTEHVQVKETVEC